MVNPRRTGTKESDSLSTGKGRAEPLNSTNRWETPGDAVQLSNLGGVLSAFAIDSAESLQRMRDIASVIKGQRYRMSSQAISEKLMAEMLLRH